MSKPPPLRPGWFCCWRKLVQSRHWRSLQSGDARAVMMALLCATYWEDQTVTCTVCGADIAVARGDAIGSLASLAGDGCTTRDVARTTMRRLTTGNDPFAVRVGGCKHRTVWRLPKFAEHNDIGADLHGPSTEVPRTLHGSATEAPHQEQGSTRETIEQEEQGTLVLTPSKPKKKPPKAPASDWAGWACIDEWVATARQLGVLKREPTEATRARYGAVVELAVRRDGHSLDDIAAALRFAVRDTGDDSWSGWQTNVTPGTLREDRRRSGRTKLDKVLDSMRRKPRRSAVRTQDELDEIASSAEERAAKLREMGFPVEVYDGPAQ